MSCKLSLLLCICILHFFRDNLDISTGLIATRVWHHLDWSWFDLTSFCISLYLSFQSKIHLYNNPTLWIITLSYHHCHPFLPHQYFPDIMWLCTSIEHLWKLNILNISCFKSHLDNVFSYWKCWVVFLFAFQNTMLHGND